MQLPENKVDNTVLLLATQRWCCANCAVCAIFLFSINRCGLEDVQDGYLALAKRHVIFPERERVRAAQQLPEPFTVTAKETSGV